MLVPSFSLHHLNFGPLYLGVRTPPPSCPVCWDEWFPNSAFNTVGKSSVTESGQDFSGVSSFYCKNMDIRGYSVVRTMMKKTGEERKESHSC